jgi:hypothetical protein
MADFEIFAPIDLTSKVSSSNLAILENAYNSGTTYDADDEIYYGIYVYKSLQGSNTNKQPDISPTWWEIVSEINTLRFHDGKTGTYSERSSNITIEVTPNTSFGGIGLFAIVAETVNINVVADTRIDKLSNGDFDPDLFGWEVGRKE